MGIWGAGVGLRARCSRASFIFLFLTGWGVGVQRCSVFCQAFAIIGESAALGASSENMSALISSGWEEVGVGGISTGCPRMSGTGERA